MSLEEDRAAMIQAGLPEPVAGMNAQAFSLIAEGDAAWLSADVLTLLGRPARSCSSRPTLPPAHRPSVLYWMLQPGAEREGVGLGVLRMIKPWHEWMLMWGCEVAAGPPEFTDDFVRELAVKLVGTEDFEMRVKSASPWTVNHQFATTIARGRVFCAGDAVHRHPPTNGLGSNTSIQDSYNLAWKLAMAVAGTAAPSLLESYGTERAPVARQIVERANQSIADTGKILTALDLRCPRPRTASRSRSRPARRSPLSRRRWPAARPWPAWPPRTPSPRRPAGPPPAWPRPGNPAARGPASPARRPGSSPASRTTS